MMNERDYNDFLFRHVNDPVFCEWYMNQIYNEVQNTVDNGCLGELTTERLGQLLIQSLLQNDAYGVLDAIASVWSDIEFVKNSYEYDKEESYEDKYDEEDEDEETGRSNIIAYIKND